MKSARAKSWNVPDPIKIEEVLQRSRETPVRLSSRQPTEAELRRETRARISVLKDEIRNAEMEIRKLELALRVLRKTRTLTKGQKIVK